MIQSIDQAENVQPTRVHSILAILYPFNEVVYAWHSTGHFPGDM
jgi:hypothetical protein